MERYNIPEPNSLDSMEGVDDGNDSKIDKDLEISPEIEGMIMEKVKDVLKKGTAHHNLTFKTKLGCKENNTKAERLKNPELIEDSIESIFRFGVISGYVDGEISSSTYKEAIRNFNKDGTMVEDRKPFSLFFYSR